MRNYEILGVSHPNVELFTRGRSKPAFELGMGIRKMCLHMYTKIQILRLLPLGARGKFLLTGKCANTGIAQLRLARIQCFPPVY